MFEVNSTPGRNFCVIGTALYPDSIDLKKVVLKVSKSTEFSINNDRGLILRGRVPLAGDDDTENSLGFKIK